MTNNYVTGSTLAGSIFEKGTTTVVWTITDASSNSTTVSQTIVVYDDQTPTITSAGNQSVSSDPGKCTYTLTGSSWDATFSDNCSGYTITNDFNSGTTLDGAIFDKGTTTIVWTSTDASSNSTTVSQTIVVYDDQTPTINCIADVTVSMDLAACGATLCAGESDFKGAYAFANWTELTEGDASITKVDSSELILHGSNSGEGALEQTDYSIEIPCDAKISFDYNYTTVDEAEAASFDPFGYTINGVLNPIVGGTEITDSGSRSIHVSKGQVFSFNISSVDGMNGAASATIRNFKVDYSITPTYSDNCGVTSVTAVRSDSARSLSDIFPVGTTNVVWSVSDAAGNTASCSMNVTVIDDVNPTISCVDAQTRATDIGFNDYTVNGTELDPAFDDNCTGATITNDVNSSASLNGEILALGSHTIHWTVTDASGNSATCETSVLISDDQSPTIACVGDHGRSTDDANCYYTVIGDEFDATFTDNETATCIITNDHNSGSSLSGSTFPVGATTVTWTVTDVSSHTATCSFIVTVFDNQTPTITCVNNQTRYLSTGCNYTVSGAEFDPNHSDNCSGEIISNDYQSGTTLDGAEFPEGTTTVFWTIRDASDNETICSFEVFVADNFAPSISCTGTLTVASTTGMCGYVAISDELDPLTSDNCGIPTLYNDYNSSSTLADAYFTGTTIVNWMVTDASGNTASCTSTIIVIDLESPTISCIGSQSRYTTLNSCDYLVIGDELDPTFDDNCSGSTLSNNLSSGSSLAGNTLPQGTTEVVWTATDANGNQTTCMTSITVIDNQSPTLSCASDITIYTSISGCTSDHIILDPVSDNCTNATWGYSLSGSTIATDSSIADGSNSATIEFNTGITLVTISATDGDNNAIECGYTITVIDNTPPTVNCVGDQTRNISATCSYTAVGTEFDPSSYGDNCSSSTIAITNNYNNSCCTLAGATFPAGITTVIWTVTDASGNTTTCSFNVVIVDNQAPAITCVGNQTRNTDASSCSYEVDGAEFDPSSYSDNCSSASIVNDYNSSASLNGASFGKGSTTVVWTVTDGAGNTSTCSFVVTIIDNENPTMSCLSSQTRGTNTGCTYVVSGSEFNPATFDDNCTGATISNNYNNGTSLSGAVFAKGTTTVLWTVTDASGNLATCSTNITIVDLEAPTINCAINQSRCTNAGLCTYTVSGTEFDPTYSDNCTGTITVSNDNNRSSSLGGAVLNKGTNTIVWTVTDASGNTNTCSTVINVVDNIAPTITCASNITMNVITNTNAANYTITDPINDNCTGSVWSYVLSGATSGSASNINDGDGSGLVSFNKGVTLVTISGHDASSNLATGCSFTVTVIDNQAPIVTCPGNQTIYATATCTSTYTINDPLTDNGNNAKWSYTLSGVTSGGASNIADGTSSGSITFNKGITTVTLNATDGVSNATPCSFTVTVLDNQAPTLVCGSNQTINVIANTCAANYTIVDPITDNCNGSTWGYIISGSTTANVDGISDGSGNRTVSLNKGSNLITLSGTDGRNNATGCSFTIVVKDNQAPVIACVSYQTIYTGSSSTGSYTIADPISDNCSGATWNYTLAGATSGSASAIADGTSSGPLSLNKGITSIALSGTDGTNAANTCAFRVTVIDNYAPTITCVSNKTVTSCVATSQVLTSPITDNCTGAKWSYTLTGATSGSGLNIAQGTNATVTVNPGITTVTYSGVDASGNTASGCTYTINVRDNVPPAVSCPSNITVSVASATCATAATYKLPAITITDNCSNPKWSYVVSGATTGSGSNYLSGAQSGYQQLNRGVNNIAITATDISGNNATCAYTITVDDGVAPTIACPSNRTVSSGCSSIIASPISDNCTSSSLKWGYTLSGATSGSQSGIAYSSTATPTFNYGVTTVTLSGTDGVRAATTCSFTVNSTDGYCGLGKTSPNSTSQTPAEPKGKVDLNVFPNPTSGAFNVDIKSDLQGPLTITIYNYLGQEIQTISKPDFTGTDKVLIDLNDVASTYYMVKVEMAGKTMYKKVIVTKR